MEPANDSERDIAAAFPHGDQVDFDESALDSRRVRAEFLAALLMGDSPGRHLRIRGWAIAGVLDLDGAEIAAPATLTDCTFEAPPHFRDANLRSLRMPGCICPGLDATNLHVEGNLELNEGFTANGEVTLLGARVDGDVKMAHAVLRNLDEKTGANRALDASRLTVRGGFLAKGLVAQGQVRLISARIGGLLNLAGGQLRNPAGIALHGERLEVGESIFFQPGFEANGRVFLQNASVKGGIDATKSTFRGGTAKQRCFDLVRGTVGRNVSLSHGTIDGSMNIRSASVRGDVYLDGARFISADGTVDASHLKTSTLNLCFAAAPQLADLRYAQVEIIEDDASTWPAELRLDGFMYRVLRCGKQDSDDWLDGSRPLSVAERIRWLRLDTTHYKPFAYDQLMASYRVAGDDRSASRVGLEKQRQRRRTLSLPGRVWGFVQDGTVGYGYRNWWAALWILALIVGASIVFTISSPTPKPDAPPFQPVVYAADLLLPIVDLGQGNSFLVQDGMRWIAWTLVMAGWVLTAAVVAGVNRLLNRS